MAGPTLFLMRTKDEESLELDRLLAPHLESEAPDESFRRRLEAQGFRTETHRTGRGGLRHWVVLGRRPGLSEPAKPN